MIVELASQVLPILDPEMAHGVEVTLNVVPMAGHCAAGSVMIHSKLRGDPTLM